MIKVLLPDMPRAEFLMPYLRRIDEARWYTNFGALNSELEARLAALYDNSVVTVSSCTLGLELVLSSVRWPHGSRVLTPSFSFPATASAILRSGLTPLYCDVDPETWALTPAIARDAARTNSFVAILPVCTYGAAQDVAEWEKVEN